MAYQVLFFFMENQSTNGNKLIFYDRTNSIDSDENL